MLQLIAKARSIRRSATIPSNYDCPLDLCKQKCTHTRSHTRCAQLVGFHIRTSNKSITFTMFQHHTYSMKNIETLPVTYWTVVVSSCGLLQAESATSNVLFIWFSNVSVEKPHCHALLLITSNHSRQAILKCYEQLDLFQCRILSIYVLYIFYMNFMLGHWPFKCYSRNPQYQTKLELLEESSVPINPICSEICIFLK